MNDLPIGHVRKLYVTWGEMVLQFTNHPVSSIRRNFVGGFAGQLHQGSAAQCRRRSCSVYKFRILSPLFTLGLKSKRFKKYYTGNPTGIQPSLRKFEKQSKQ